MRAGVADAVIAAGLLAVLAPVLLLLMLLNHIFSRRVFFRQVRLGLNLRPFTLLKLSTMVDGAELQGTVTVEGDSRVTPFGRFLRRFKLDEVPQLLNIMRGDLRWVGPRALPACEIETLPPELASAVYVVPPGLTGIGCLAFIDEERQLAELPDPRKAYFASVLPRKMQLELDYRRRRTAVSDLTLVLLTVPVLLLPRMRPRILGWFVAGPVG